MDLNLLYQDRFPQRLLLVACYQVVLRANPQSRYQDEALALPGTLSGTIIGLAQALGETAPLILIGMVAFVVDIPSTPIDPSASLPVQVYLWSESAERGFVEKTSATIMMLLSFLIVMNFLAVYLRQKFEKRWN